jgi:hypothetical protein
MRASGATIKKQLRHNPCINKRTWSPTRDGLLFLFVQVQYFISVSYESPFFIKDFKMQFPVSLCTCKLTAYYLYRQLERAAYWRASAALCPPLLYEFFARFRTVRAVASLERVCTQKMNVLQPILIVGVGCEHDFTLLMCSMSVHYIIQKH